MALPAWQATIVNEFGDIIPSPVITVIVEATGLPASLFSNRGGTTPLGSGGVFTAGVDGFAQFFAAPAEYRVTASDAGSGFSQTWDFVVLSGTAATTDTQTSTTDETAGRGLLVGAFGLGGVAVEAPSNDLHQIVTGGTYKDDTASNAPAGSQSGSTCFASVFDNNDKTLLYFDRGGVIYSENEIAGVWQGWQPVYTGANLNPNVFDGATINDILCHGFAVSATTARLFLPISSFTVPISITINSTIDIRDAGFSIVGGGSTLGPANITIEGLSSYKLCSLSVTGLSGLTIGEPIVAAKDTADSKITVNF